MKKTLFRLCCAMLTLTLLLSSVGLFSSTAQDTATTASESFTFSEEVPFIKIEDESGVRFYGPTGDLSLEDNTVNNADINSVEDYLKLTQNVKNNLAPVGNTPLPSEVDNSQSEYFPAVGDQKGLGSCVAFAQAYYQFTYHMNKARGIKTTPENTFAPKFLYNITNKGINDGLHYDSAYRFLQGYGCAPASLVSYDDTEYLNWFADEGIWREAMRYRVESYYEFAEVGILEEGTQITSADDTDLLAIKTALHNGDILTYSTLASSWGMTNLKTNPDAPENNKYPNEYAVKGLVDIIGGHRMALVGYNDKIWIDVNENNKVDAGETGAFKVVNSWSEGYGNKGFCWVAYDALNDQSCVEGMSTAKRERIFEHVTSMVVKPYNQGADAYVEFTMNSADRTQFDVYVTAEKNGTEITHKFLWGAAAYINDNNHHSFIGTKEACDGTFAYSLDNIVPNIKSDEVSQYSWDIRFVDRENDDAPLVIKNAVVISEKENLILNPTFEFPSTVNGSEKNIRLGSSSLNNAVIYYIGYDCPTIHYKNGDDEWKEATMDENTERIGHNYKYVIEDIKEPVLVYFSDQNGNVDDNKGNFYTAYRYINNLRTTEGDGIKEPLMLNKISFENGKPDTKKSSIFKLDYTGGYAPYRFSYVIENTTTGNTATYDYDNLTENRYYFTETGLYRITANVMDQTGDISTLVYEYDLVDMEFIFKSFGATSDEKMFVGNEITFIAESEYEGVYSFANQRNKYDFAIVDSKGNTCYTERKNSDKFNTQDKQSTTTLNWIPSKSGTYTITISSTDIDKSYAEKTFSFEVFDKIYGDADGDNIINIKDATFIQKFIAQIESEDKFYKEMADCDIDENVTIKDATAIQKYIALIEDTSEVGNCIEYIPPVIPTEPVTTAPTEPETEPVTTKPVPVNNTVTFTNSLRWSGPIYCYYWSDSNSAMTSWPGKVMDFLKTNDYGEDMFTFEVPAEATYIIFTNNKSQTVDIPYAGGEMRYYAISETDSKGAYKYGTW